MYSRTNPFQAEIKERKLLTALDSSKKTYHVELAIDDTIAFQPGDSIAILPSNDPALVDEILQKLSATGHEEIFDKNNTPHTFRDFLLHKANISKVSFHKLFPVEKTASPLIDLLQTHQPAPSELCKILLPLMPRFYSIASSTKVHPNEAHLTVALAQESINGRIHFGVGSHFLCKQATTVPIYVQPSNHFALPAPEIPIIMIGPGTGVAPFRAFLQERLAENAPGANWLFFGERNRASDFYYADFWLSLEKEKKLRLDTAFSRDQAHKIYVQHRMLEAKKEFWRWIQNGAYIYVCGDADQMAKDVDFTLQQIIASEGNMIEEEARKFLKNLRLEKRYLLDVY